MNLETIKTTAGKVGRKIAVAPAALCVAMSNVMVTYCDPNLFDKDDQTANNLLITICGLYQRWALPFIIIGLILFALTKDEKKKETEKKAVIIMAIVYVLTYCTGLISGSLSGLGNTLGGTTTTAP